MGLAFLIFLGGWLGVRPLYLQYLLGSEEADLCGHRDDEPAAPRGRRVSGTRLTRSGRREMCMLPEPCNLSDLLCCPGLIPAALAGNYRAFGAEPEPPGSWRGSWREGELLPALSGQKSSSCCFCKAQTLYGS